MSKITAFQRVQALLPRLAKLTGSIPGLDASLMLVQYSSPAVIALLMILARIRDRYPSVNFSLRGGKQSISGGTSLRILGEAWAKVGGSIGDARVIMRAFGLIPVLIPASRLLVPDPIKSLIFSPGPTIQILALLAYYPLEHISWLASKGVISMNPQTIQKTTLWSVRFWALYVMLELVKIRQKFFALKTRTKALKNSKPSISTKEAEGYELESGSSSAAPPVTDQALIKKKKELRKDWDDWKDSVLTNAGYAPLTIHWSAGGLWSNPLITALFGSAAAIGQLRSEWRKHSNV